MTDRTVLGRYRRAPLRTRLFLAARWRLTPYAEMAAQLPERGAILDLGCGHGLLALAAATGASARDMVCVDHDAERVAVASRALGELPNVRLEFGDLVDALDAGGPWSGIAMIDVLHYFGAEAQEAMLRQAFAALRDGGTLLVREVDAAAGASSVWNRAYERVATVTGFTRTARGGLCFRSRTAWEELLRGVGFGVASRRCGSALFADVLFVCTRPGVVADRDTMRQ